VPNQQPKSVDYKIRVVQDQGVLSVLGKCPSCYKGDRSLIITDFEPSYFGRVHSTVFMRCLACDATYQTQVSAIAD
jgi:hypothetical protein